MFQIKRNRRSNNNLDNLNITHVDDATLDRVLRISENGWSFVPKRRLISIAGAVDRVMARAVPGCLIEAGCARGGSAGLIAARMGAGRALHLYDVFETIPPPDATDGDRAQALYDSLDSSDDPALRTYMDHVTAADALERTRDIVETIAGDGFDPADLHLHKGLVQDTMALAPDTQVAFAHIDLDWYDPTLHTLRQIMPRTVPGSVVVIDDVFYWPGCGTAVAEYFADCAADFLFDGLHGHLIVERFR